MGKNLRKTIIWVAILGLITFFILRRAGVFDNAQEQTLAQTTAAKQSAVIPADGVVASRGSLQNSLALTGSIMANESVDLKSEISGKITGIYFKEGDPVQKGQLLVKTNDSELKAQLEKAKYTQQLKEKTEFRQRKLLEKEAISREEYELALTDLNTAKADVQLLKAQLDKTEVRAPFSGVIGLRNVSLGANLTPSIVIANLYKVNPAKIQFAIPGKYVDRVAVGDAFTFNSESNPDTFHGKIYALEPNVDPSTRSFKVRGMSPNENRQLIPGQFVTIHFPIERKEGSILLPSIAVIPELEGHKVFTVKGGKVASQKVEIGIRTEKSVEILSGLHVGDTVLTTGLLQVKEGVPVNVTIKQ